MSTPAFKQQLLRKFDTAAALEIPVKELMKLHRAFRGPRCVKLGGQYRWFAASVSDTWN